MSNFFKRMGKKSKNRDKDGGVEGTGIVQTGGGSLSTYQPSAVSAGYSQSVTASRSVPATKDNPGVSSSCSQGVSSSKAASASKGSPVSPNYSQGVSPSKGASASKGSPVSPNYSQGVSSSKGASASKGSPVSPNYSQGVSSSKGVSASKGSPVSPNYSQGAALHTGAKDNQANNAGVNNPPSSPEQDSQLEFDLPPGINRPRGKDRNLSISRSGRHKYRQKGRTNISKDDVYSDPQSPETSPQGKDSLMPPWAGAHNQQRTTSSSVNSNSASGTSSVAASCRDIESSANRLSGSQRLHTSPQTAV